jgi:hypothetical protein
VRRSRDDAEAAKLKDFRIADRGEEVVAAWTFCTARRVRTWQQLDIWGTSADTETERVLWEPRPTYPRGCQRRRKAFPYLVVTGRTLPSSRSTCSAAGFTNHG